MSHLQIRRSGSQSDDDSFDPDDAFGQIEPDYGSIHRRETARIEREKAESEKKARMEKDRLAERLERQRLDDENDRKFMEDSRRRQLERDEKLARKRDEELRLLPGRMDAIKAYEERVHGPASAWPQPLTAQQLNISDETFADMHRDLHLDTEDTGSLPDPFPDFNDQAASDKYDNPMDAHYRKDHYTMAQIHNSSHLLDTLPKVFNTESDIMTSGAGKYYRDLCYGLYGALKSGLYAYDRNISNNLENRYTKRLRSYYQHIKWAEYEHVDLVDGWTTLLQLALIIEPSHHIVQSGSTANERLRKWLDSLRHVTRLFDETKRNVGKIKIGDSIWQGDIAQEILKTTSSIHENMSGVGTAGRLLKILEQRMASFYDWYDENRWYPDASTVTDMRSITKNIIAECAKYFVDRQDDTHVRFLRSIAFGHTPIDFKKMKSHWLYALKEIPDDVFSFRSRQWEEAVKLAGARLYGFLSKDYRWEAGEESADRQVPGLYR
jgi:hypothetical protein